MRLTQALRWRLGGYLDGDSRCSLRMSPRVPSGRITDSGLLSFDSRSWTSQWDGLSLPSPCNCDASDSFLVPSPQEEKGTRHAWFKQQFDPGHRRWESFGSLPTGLVSLGGTSRCLAMADSAAHTDGRRPLPVGCQSMGLLRYAIAWLLPDCASINVLQGFKFPRCTEISRPSGIGWRSPTICLWPSGISMTCNIGASTILR